MGEKVAVSTYSGFKADERPTSFSVGERTFEIRRIIDRWYDIDGNYFKVVTAEGSTFLLRHDLNEGSWELVELPPRVDVD